MPYIKIKKNTSSTPYKPLYKNNFLLCEQHRTSGNFRILVKNFNSVIAKQAKGTSFVVAESKHMDLIKEEYRSLKHVLVPILLKFATSNHNLRISLLEIQSIIDGIGERIHDREKKRKTVHKEKRKEKKSNFQKKKKPQPKRNYDSGSEESESESEESSHDESDEDIELPDNSDSEEDTHLTDDEEETEEDLAIRSIEDLEDNLGQIAHELKHIRRCVGRYSKNPKSVEKTSLDTARAVRDVTRMKKQMNKFFFENKKRILRSNPKRQEIYEKLRITFERKKESIDEIIKSKDVQELVTLSQQFSGASSKLVRQMKKKQEKRLKNRAKKLAGKTLQGVEDEDAQVLAQQQMQKKKKFRLRLEDAATIDTETERAKEEREELLELNSDMNELMDMMKDMSYLVDKQQDDIDDIGECVEEAIIHVEKGRKHIKKASGFQKGGIRKIITTGGLKLATKMI